MSGQPYKKFTDVNKFRNEYLDALNIRASLDDMNLQANKNFKSTGSLPAVSQMKDTRTTSEILADTEKLKIDIVTALSKISNPQFAAAVVQRIMSNPNNQDNSLLIFTAQRINDLVDKLSRIYAYGIKGDTNDVQQIVNFLTSMYSDKNAIASSTKDYLQNYTSRNIGGYTQGRSNQFADTNRLLLSIKSYLVTLITKMEPLVNRFMDDEDSPYINLMHITDRLVVLLTILMDVIPSSTNVIDQIDTIFSKLLDGQAQREDQANRSFINLMILYKDFISSGIPNTNQISLAFKKVELYTQNVNPESLEAALINLTSVLLPSEEWTFDKLRDLARNINYRDIENVYQQLTSIDQRGEQQPYDAPMTPEGNNDDEEAEDDDSATISQRSRQSSIPTEQQRERAKEFVPKGGKQKSKEGYVQKTRSTRDEVVAGEIERVLGTIKRLNHNELADVYIQIKQNLASGDYGHIDRDSIDKIYTTLDINPETENLEPGYFLKLSPEEMRARLMDAIIRRREDGKLVFLYNYRQDDFGIHGLGISSGKTGGINQQRKRGRPKGSGLQRKYSEVVKSSTATDKGIDEDRRFIKFGKYLINNKKLNDSILAVKRPSGNNIIEFPTQHITSNFKNVIKTMIGGGMPKYEELDRLSEAEKTYLHKLASKANIIDKFSIPAPSKSQHEKDIHDFEVMKGEIMSGNDNNDLIKKFKIHILKLSKTGALPKREVMELLETLLELGY